MWIVCFGIFNSFLLMDSLNMVHPCFRKLKRMISSLPFQTISMTFHANHWFLDFLGHEESCLVPFLFSEPSFLNHKDLCFILCHQIGKDIPFVLVPNTSSRSKHTFTLLFIKLNVNYQSYFAHTFQNPKFSTIFCNDLSTIIQQMHILWFVCPYETIHTLSCDSSQWLLFIVPLCMVCIQHI